MADIPSAPQQQTPPPMPPLTGDKIVKAGLAILVLVVVVWFGQDAVVSLFRGEASNNNEEVDLTNIPPQVVCDPAVQTVRVNQPVALSASGGDPNDYKWYAPGGEPFTQIGTQATVRYSTTGPKAVVVVSKVRTAKCDVTVTQ